MWHSSRSNKMYDSYQAIVAGLAPDGGLFIPDKLPKITFNETWLNYSYQEIAFIILKAFLSEFEDNELRLAISKAYSSRNFNDAIYRIKSFETHSYLELFHGPTLAFKDMALTLFPYLVDLACKHLKLNKKITILTATSGDTGGATLSGFSKLENINVVVLYPHQGVSKFQEKQMLSFTNEHAKAFSVNGNFDDCQSAVKKLFLELKNDDNLMLCSANSINIGRLLPQIVYYFVGYLDLVKNGHVRFGDVIDVCVPTGNFGNILAAYLAKRIGLPIDKLICASNENNVLTDFFAGGIYDRKRPFFQTISPSMDILISSNLERLIALLSDNTDEVKDYMQELNLNGSFKISETLFSKLKDFRAYYATEEETLNEIKDVYLKNNYLIDPHTAVAKCAYNKAFKDKHTLIVSTASPVKFQQTINNALTGHKITLERADIKKIKNIMACDKPEILMDITEIKEYLLASKYLVTVPASTANLCVGFDTAGMALALYNKFSFYKSKRSRLIGFYDDNLENNLLYQAYLYTFNYLQKEVQPITVNEELNDVFVCRGLGSSATCIVSGVKMALKMLEINDNKLLVKIATLIEGHPDNVVPTVYGGLNISLLDNDDVFSLRYKVSSKLKFTVAVPCFTLSTKISRQALPKKVIYKDIVNNLSRVANLPFVFEKGDLKLLRVLFNDRLHEPYRLKLIQGASELIKAANDLGFVCCLSGAGPTILLIADKYCDRKKLANYSKIWQFKKLKVDKNGLKMEEI